MTQLFRAVVVSSMFISAAALAQDVEMDMNVQVDEDGMPSANIKMKVPDQTGDQEDVNMRVRSSSTRMEVKMKVPPGQIQEQPEEQTEFVEQQPRRRRAPEPAPVFRNCGPQSDPGCTMTRDGQYPMDAETFSGFLQSLKSQSNELVREETVQKVLKRNYMTAAQFGLVLDLFRNELTRLEVAKVAAPRVVNPQHALGFSSKWKNSISGGEYVELISAQQE